MKKLIAMMFIAVLLLAGSGYAEEKKGNPADNATATHGTAPAADNATAETK